MKKVLVISDMQIPFHHPDSMEFLKAVKKKYKPNEIINIGDIVDSYCLSQYPKSPEAPSATEEIDNMKEAIAELGKIFPKMTIIKGNHDRRLERMAFKAGIHKHFLKSYSEWTGAPKKWQFVSQAEVDGVLYLHGDESGAGGMNAALKRVYIKGMSVVAGHLHTQACIKYTANSDHLHFGMQVGCLIDKDAVAFGYAKRNLSKVIISVGFVNKGKPELIMMDLDKDGRWTGKL